MNNCKETPEWSDIYWLLEDSNNPLHFLFRENADFKKLAEYLHSCGVSRSRPRSGEWIPVFDPAALWGDGDVDTIIYYKCSVCGRREPTRQPYCNCGAKMKTE